MDDRGENNERGFEGGTDGNPTWWRKMFAAHRRRMHAGVVDAETLGGNRFRVRAPYARRFALWLHPKTGMEFNKPIEIELVHMTANPNSLIGSEQRREKIVTMAAPSLAARLKYLGGSAISA